MCEEYALLISRMLDDDLSREEAEALRAHLADCPSCRMTYEALSAVTEAVRNTSEEPPADLSGGVMDRIRAYENAPKHRPWKKALIAACLAVVIGAGGFSAWLGARRMGGADSMQAEEISMAAAMEEAAPAAAEEALPMEVPASMAENGGGSMLPAAGAGYGALLQEEPTEAEAAEAEEDVYDAGRAYDAGIPLGSVEEPALVPPGKEEAFRDLLDDARITPSADRVLLGYVEYRGVIYELSEDGGHLVWRDAAEGFAVTSTHAPEDLLSLWD